VARTPLLNLRVDDATKLRWQAGASERGYTLAEFVRASVEAELAKDLGRESSAADVDGAGSETSGHHESVGERQGRRPAPEKKRRTRATMCEHRIPPESFCPHGCD